MLPEIQPCKNPLSPGDKSLRPISSLQPSPGTGRGCSPDQNMILWPPDKPLSESPGPLVDGFPVGILPADSPEQLQTWLAALQVPRPATPFLATMAMGATPFLEKSDSIRDTLQAVFPGKAVHNWQADVIDRNELSGNLTTGPELAVYTGHGRHNCWSGYQVIKWQTIDKAQPHIPIGTLMHFACSTMAGQKSAQSFGAKWVLSGRALSSFGLTGQVKVTVLCKLIDVFLYILSTHKPRHLGEWLVHVDLALKQRPDHADLHEAFGRFRVVGSPEILFDKKKGSHKLPF